MLSQLHHTVIVRKYGAPTRGGRNRIIVPEYIEEQFTLARELHNALVDIHQAYEADIEAAWLTVPVLAAADADVKAALDAKNTVEEQVKAERVLDQTTVARAATSITLAQAKKDLAAARKAYSDAKALYYPSLAALMHQAKAKESEAQKATYATFVQERGLFWATHGDVLAHHKTAIKVVAKQRAAKQKAELRHKRHGKPETITIQLQRAGGLPISVTVTDPVSGLQATAVKGPFPARLKTDEATYVIKIAGIVDLGATVSAQISTMGGQPVPEDFTYHWAIDDVPVAGATGPDFVLPTDPDSGIVTDPVRSPELLASGEGPWRNVVQIRPWVEPTQFKAMSRSDQRKAGTGVVAMRFGKDLPTWELPVLVHDMLPAEADIALVKLTRRHVAGRAKLTVSVTAKMPPVAKSTNTTPLAMHLGWRARKDQSVRVATLLSHTGPLTVPAHLRDVVLTHDDASWAEVILPAFYRDLSMRTETLASERDKNRDAIRGELVAFLEKYGPGVRIHPVTGEVISLTAALVAKWQAPGKFASLTMNWIKELDLWDTPRHQHLSKQHGIDAAAVLVAQALNDNGAVFPGSLCASLSDQERYDAIADFARLLAMMEFWRVQDKHLWNWQEHGREQMLARRDDTWRKVAAWLTSTYGHVMLADYSVADLAKVPALGEEDTPQNRAARSLRTLSAPGMLKECMTKAAYRRGTLIESTDAVAMAATRTHYECGHLNPDDDRYKANPVVMCDNCENKYDQDHNADQWALSAKGFLPPAPAGTGAALAA